MNKREQIQFINDLIDDVKHKIFIQIVEDKLPENWDGIELRWLLASRFDASWVMPEAKKRKRDFRNYVLVNNL
jgi:hypothetical protein